jgi:hypothetical protein
VTGVTVDTITTDAVMTPDEYQGLIIYPNSGDTDFTYKILTHATSTITVLGPIDTGKVSINDTFAIVYGKLIRDTIELSRITDPPPAKVLEDRTVKFFNTTGAKSYADGDSTYDGVCEVCHSETSHFRNNSGGSDPLHTNVGSPAGTDCRLCHEHTDGFKPSCGACHGYPPVNPATLVFTPGPTGSGTAGAHQAHAITKAYDCESCHLNSVGAGIFHNDGPPQTVTSFFMIQVMPFIQQ